MRSSALLLPYMADVTLCPEEDSDGRGAPTNERGEKGCVEIPLSPEGRTMSAAASVLAGLAGHFVVGRVSEGKCDELMITGKRLEAQLCCRTSHCLKLNYSVCRLRGILLN